MATMWFIFILLGLSMCDAIDGPQDVVCPDNVDVCPTSNTCCQMPDRKTYGCCPYPNAVCCSDRQQCCPSGFTCDLANHRCDSSFHIIPFYWMAPIYKQDVFDNLIEPERTQIVEKIEVEEKTGVKCPNGDYCSQGTSCCQLKNGGYGCCPYKVATCCSDQIHCCPSRFTCDIKHKRCLNPRDGVNFRPPYFPIFNIETKVFEAAEEPLAVENCPYSFCAFLNMQCCARTGGIDICCLKDLKCPSVQHAESFKCLFVPNWNNGRNGLDTLGLAKDTIIEPTVTVCPDKTEVCPPFSTCCPMSSTTYGCCQSPEATCCSDKQHCCPSGYVCAGYGCQRKPSLLSVYGQPLFVDWIDIQKGS